MCFLMSKQLINVRTWSALCLWAWCALASAEGLRIVTLAPHATESVFAAGAGQQIVGTVASSDFPELARSIPKVGDGLNTSAEQVLALNPDWVIGWPSSLLSQLGELGIDTMTVNPESLEGIGQSVLQLGQIMGTLPDAQAWHKQFTHQMQSLDEFDANTSEKPLRVVILASANAQYVIGRHTLINDTLERCGAINPFAQTQAAAPQISRESLIAAKPDVIISGTAPDNPQTMKLIAPLAVMDEDSLYRPGPRFINAAKAICQLVQQKRQQRSKE